jgi:NADPH:quinone reductase-like Zn-dependent oxidoreductase
LPRPVAGRCRHTTLTEGTRRHEKAEGGSAIDRVSDRARALAELADAISQGKVVVPIAHVYALDDVQAAYRELAQGHTLGKIVLVP